MTPSLGQRIQRRIRRELTMRFSRRIQLLAPGQAMISFTFDDFPASAAETGRQLLEEVGVRGTFYASFGLMGRDSPVGPIFDGRHIQALTAARHEIACHTFDHRDAAATKPAMFAASLSASCAAFKLAGLSAPASFSYPKNLPRLSNKRLAGARYSSCRGGDQAINRGLVDLSLLHAFFLEKAESASAVCRVVDDLMNRGGWLILATHDVARRPTAFGVSTDFFRTVVAHAVAAGAHAVTVAEGVARLRTDTPSNRTLLQHAV